MNDATKGGIFASIVVAVVVFAACVAINDSMNKTSDQTQQVPNAPVVTERWQQSMTPSLSPSSVPYVGHSDLPTPDSANQRAVEATEQFLRKMHPEASESEISKNAQRVVRETDRNYRSSRSAPNNRISSDFDTSESSRELVTKEMIRLGSDPVEAEAFTKELYEAQREWEENR